LPCNDITEEIRIILDNDDRLKPYTLRKKTCGGAVGIESLLIDSLAGKAVADLIAVNEFTFQQEHLPEDHIMEFLNLKHLIAVKSVLNAYLGNISAGAGDPCSIAGIESDGEGTIIDADIDIGLMTDKIKSCSHCGPG